VRDGAEFLDLAERLGDGGGMGHLLDRVKTNF
jgi:hypothetical protein